LLGIFACEERAYNHARDQGTPEALEQFLKKYPDSRHQGEARGQWAFVAFRKTAAKNTVAAYEDYLRDFPDSSLRILAVKNLTILLEPEFKTLAAEQMSKMKGLVKTEAGVIVLRLEPEKAPESCRNFIKLARTHFYDRSFFTMIVPGVLVQAGSPNGDLAGGPGYFLKPEPNDLPNVPGAVGMAHGAHPETAGSQFYICLQNLPERNGKFTVFAMVESGLETARDLSYLENTGPRGNPSPYRPLKPLLIQTVEIVRIE